MNRRIICAIAVLPALTAAAVAMAGPTSTRAPKLVGTVAFDRTVTCDPGTFTPTPASISYAWAAGGGPIADATKSTLTIDKPYLMGGYDITCTVTATDAAGSATAVSSPAVRPALGATTMKITSVKVKPKGAFVIKGQIGPKHLVAKYIEGAQVVLNRKVPGKAKGVFQLSESPAPVDKHGRFTVTGHDRVGKRKVLINFYPGNGGTSLWSPATVTRTIKVTPGFTGSGGLSVGT
jgi:hypothetical protein